MKETFDDIRIQYVFCNKQCSICFLQCIKMKSHLDKETSQLETLKKKQIEFEIKLKPRENEINVFLDQLKQFEDKLITLNESREELEGRFKFVNDLLSLLSQIEQSETKSEEINTQLALLKEKRKKSES